MAYLFFITLLWTNINITNKVLNVIILNILYSHLKEHSKNYLVLVYVVTIYLLRTDKFKTPHWSPMVEPVTGFIKQEL